VAPILTGSSFDVITHSSAQTFRLGEILGRMLGPGDVVCLRGDLGSGKTRLVQGIGSGLGVRGTIRSPSFVLIAEHPPSGEGPRLYHVDLYRVNDVAAARALGLEDCLYGDGVTVIEWAERARALMPERALWICLSYLSYTKRSLVIEAPGEHYASIVAALKEELQTPKGRRPG